MNKRITYHFFLSILFLFSCQKLDKPSKPDNFIPEDKMVELLTDIAFVKAAKGSYNKFLETENINPESYIVQKHGIDSAVFVENNRWYASRLETYEQIFRKVKNNLEVSKKKYVKLKKEADSIKKIKDSINRAKNNLKEKILPVDLDGIKLIDEESIEEGIKKTIKKSKKSKSILGKKKQ